jgi:hypothetical protein
VDAYKADDSGKVTVIILAQDFRLPEVLRHIEAGRIVCVIPATQRPPPAGLTAKKKRLTPGICPG